MVHSGPTHTEISSHAPASSFPSSPAVTCGRSLSALRPAGLSHLKGVEQTSHLSAEAKGAGSQVWDF